MIALTGLLCGLVLAVSGLPTEAPPPPVNFLGEGTERLSISLLQCDAENRTNLVFSPLGYSVILAVLAEGSRGVTRDQLVSYLNYPEDTYAARNTYKTVLTKMEEANTVGQPQFKNWFYVYKDFSVQEHYKKVLEENFLTEVKEVERDDAYFQEPSSSSPSSSPGTSTTTNSPGSPGTHRREQPVSPIRRIIQWLKKLLLPLFTFLHRHTHKSVDRPISLNYYHLGNSVVRKRRSNRGLHEVPSNSPLPKARKGRVVRVRVRVKTPKPGRYSHPMRKPVKIGVPSEKLAVGEEGESTEDNKPLEEVDLRATTLQPADSENEVDRSKADIRRSVEQQIMSSISANRLSSSQENSTTAESKVIVFNALYFKGVWAQNFSEVAGGSEFETGDGKKITAPSMQVTGEFEYGRLRQLRATAISLPYEGGRYSLLVVLPDRSESLPSLIKRLAKISLSQLQAQLSKRQVKVTLPTFNYYSISRPKTLLKEAGVNQVFDEKADLSGITGENGGLFLEDLVQLVTIEVTPGTSAYNFLTSTNVASLRQSGLEFTAQRPFLYFLRDRVDNYVVVAGKVENPTVPGFS